MTNPKRIYTAFLKLAVSIIFIFLSMKAFGFGGFSSSIIAGILFLIGVFHHVFWDDGEIEKDINNLGDNNDAIK